MRYALGLAASWAWLCLVAPGVMARPEDPTRFEVTVATQSQSQIRGTAEIAPIKIAGEFGEVEVPAAKIARITANQSFDGSRVHTIETWAGNRLVGTIALDSVAQETEIGRLAIPWERVTSLTFAKPEGPKS